jgi:hypothetical protein
MTSCVFDWKYLNVYLNVDTANWFEAGVEVYKYGVDMTFGVYGVALHIWFGWN